MTPYRCSLFLVFVLSCWTPISAQELIGLSVEYADTYREWNVIPADEEIDIGKIQLSWPYNDTWTDWEYEVANRFGTIRQKWINEKDNFELIDGEYIVTIKNQWRGDLSDWKISFDDFTFRFESTYNNIADEWEMKSKDYGTFFIYTEFEGDPRDWIIEDYLSPEVPLAMKMAMIFVTIRYSAPRR